MKILSVGIPEHEIVQLRQLHLTIEMTSTDDFDIVEWLDRDLYSGLLINLDEGFGTMICRELRQQGISTPVIGVASEGPDELWSYKRTSFLENGGDDLLDFLQPT